MILILILILKNFLKNFDIDIDFENQISENIDIDIERKFDIVPCLLDSTPKCLYSCKIEIKHATTTPSSLKEHLSCRTSQCLREGLNQTKHILACKIFWAIHWSTGLRNDPA